jgi:hypothetical protein
MILKIGSEHLSSEEYSSTVVGLLVRLFSSPDRAIRHSLLENLNSFVDKIEKRTINDKIFPEVVRSLLPHVLTLFYFFENGFYLFHTFLSVCREGNLYNS